MDQENEIISNLIEQFGLNDLPKFKSQTQRILIWKQITEEFNIKTGNDWNVSRLKNRWKNYKDGKLKGALKNVKSEDFIKIDTEKNIGKTSEASDNSIIQNDKNVSSIEGVSIGYSKHQHENDILVNLVKQFELNKLDKYSPERIPTWTLITAEFNRLTGYDWTRKRLRNRWKNYGAFLKSLNRETVPTNNGEGDMLIETDKSDHELKLETWRENEEILKNLVEKSDLDKHESDALEISIIWETITAEYNTLTGNELNSNDVAQRWTLYQQKMRSAADKKPTDRAVNREIRRKNEEILKDLVEKSDLYQFQKNTPNRIRVWHSITEEFNALTGNNLNWKVVSKRWSKCMTLAREDVDKEPNLSNSNHKCDICSKTFPEKDELDIHTKEDHPNSEYHPKKINKRKCHICSLTFGNKIRFERHYKEIHQIIDMYQCELCPKSFERRESLMRHTKYVHTKGVKSSVVCDLCGKTFTTSTTLRKHHQAVHLQIKDYICEICNKAFGESKDVKIHIKMVHEKIKDDICDLCGQSFVNRFALRNHVKNIHLGIKDHICKHCGKGFITLAKLNEHSRYTHEGYKPHKCPYCDRGFPMPNKLRLHMKSVHRGLNVELL